MSGTYFAAYSPDLSAVLNDTLRKHLSTAELDQYDTNVLSLGENKGAAPLLMPGQTRRIAILLHCICRFMAHRIESLRSEGSDAIGAKRTCRERRERVDLTKMTLSSHCGCGAAPASPPSRR
jgi:hypothetical protein